MTGKAAALWADALTYYDTHGEHWPIEAAAHAKRLWGRSDHDGFKRWQQIMHRLTEIHDLKTRH
jgi:hypothetical protein